MNQGLYRTNHLSNGVSSASAIFQGNWIGCLVQHRVTAPSAREQKCWRKSWVGESWGLTRESEVCFPSETQESELCFPSEEVEYLGYVVHERAIHPTKEKVKAPTRPKNPQMTVKKSAATCVYSGTYYTRFLHRHLHNPATARPAQTNESQMGMECSRRSLSNKAKNWSWRNQ